jgi:hypothetical protein
MAVVHIERVTCDNPECVAYAEELIRERPGRYELIEYVRAQVSVQGWASQDGRDFCPSHRPG